MTILAIDPGNERSGYCIMRSDCSPVDKGKVSNKEMMEILKDYCMRCGQQVVIEHIASYGMAVGREVFDTCEFIGRLKEVCEQRRVPWSAIYRKDEKITLCGTTKANDSNIRRALIDRFARHDLKNGKGTKADPDWFYGFSADAWAAYAVGVTWIDRNKGDDP